MPHPVLTLCCTLAFALAGIPVARAQQAPSALPPGGEDPSANARVHIGPLGLTPSLALTNLGVDTNVFNTYDNPQRDFTATLTPQADLWLHLGRGLLSGRVSAGLVYFQRFGSERAINTAGSLRFDLPLNRFRPYVIENYANARQRPNYEIDARSRYHVDATTGGIDFALFGKSLIGLYGRRDRTRYEQDAVFVGTRLADALDRNGRAAGVQIVHELTPFTTIVLRGEREQDRFEVATVKNSDSRRVSLGVELNPAALISGSATIGYRMFEALGPGVPDYNGLTASGDVRYTLLGVSQFSAQFTRDVAYSYYMGENTPYYLLTGISGALTQRFVGPFDLVARVGRQNLAYREIASGAALVANRVDHYRTYGGGLGYRASPDLRLGVNVDQEHRTTPVATRAFDGLRVGLAVTYGGR